MMARWTRDPLTRAAYILLAGSVVALCVSLWRASDLDPLPNFPEAGAALEVVQAVKRKAPPDSLLLAAVEADPFHPERRRPSVPYRLPGEAAPEAPRGVVPEAAGPVRVVGTALLPNGKSFALCEWPGRPPRLVRVGETVNGLTLKRVEVGRAVFVSEMGATVVVDVPNTGT